MSSLIKFVDRRLSNNTELKRVVKFDDFYQLMLNMGIANDEMLVHEIFLDLTEKKSYYFPEESSSTYFREYMKHIKLRNADRRIFQNREHTIQLMKMESQLKFQVPEYLKEVFENYREEEND